MTGRPKVFVTRRIPEVGLELLRERFEVAMNAEDRPLSRAEFLAAIGDAEGLLCLLTDKVDAEAMDAAAKAKGFANYAVGFDNIDLAEATRRGIPVSNTPDVLTDATAEMAWALLFAVARRVVESDGLMRSGGWKGWGPLQFIGGDVAGKTLGVVGGGRIGQAFAGKSRGFDMPILYCDERPSEAMERDLGARRVSLDELLQESDFVSVHVPLLPSTRHLVDAAALRRMKRTAYLINTARGPVVDEAALVEALRAGRIAGAGLDVYEDEPRAAEGLAALPNVVMTPHTASATVSSRNGMAVKAARNLIAMVEGKRAPDCLNPGVYGA
ncbi:MAG: D-glycerate dehydrogenase [Spirochaetaceae bacterium]|nr:D-glycerate dehydrogenase [Spirochaetaceae bacterium]